MVLFLLKFMINAGPFQGGAPVVVYSNCQWWDKAEDGVGGNEIGFSLLNALISTKMHSYSKPIYFAINIT